MGDERVDSAVGAAREWPDVSQSPPVSAMWPLAGGAPTPPGTFEPVELEAIPMDGRRWLMHATWELAADADSVVVDGVVMVMEGHEYPMRVAPTTVRPGERYRTTGPILGWRPEVLQAVRARHTRPDTGGHE